MTTHILTDLLGAASLSSELGGFRVLQAPWQIAYTSPPTNASFSATPVPWRSDESVDAMRAMAKEGKCAAGTGLARNESCQILFEPSEGVGKLGVVFYGGAAVDPRAFSPLARVLSERYSLAVSVPIFNGDLAVSFGSCDTGRMQLAMEVFPDVERWVLVGYSLGGIAAQTDLWTMMGGGNEEMLNQVGGIALLGSHIDQGGTCGAIDFSSTTIPATSVSAELDGVINQTNWKAAAKFLPKDDTFWLDVKGGNHAFFGSYDDSERKAIFGLIDGVATIPNFIQRDLSATAIAHVASRAGNLPSGTEWWKVTSDANGDDAETLPPTASPTKSPTETENTIGKDTEVPTPSPSSSGIRWAPKAAISVGFLSTVVIGSSMWLF
mmetsp:Transcript_27046/g.79927  ORF Transcript_27046/g.79927 Transcript_27046/m.79927 type:complete len:380 (-) Transcript_27046:241-1380(-)